MKKTYLKILTIAILLVTMGLAVFMTCREPNYVMANSIQADSSVFDEEYNSSSDTTSCSAIVDGETYNLSSIEKVNTFDKTMAEIYTACYNSSKPSNVSDYKKAETISIGSQEELFQFAKLVNEKRLTFEGKTVYLISDIDMSDQSWTPIAGGQVLTESFIYSLGFRGNFDGQGHIISNLQVNEDADVPAGFFGFLPATAQVADIIFYKPSISLSCRSDNRFNCAGVVAGASSGFITSCAVYKASVSVGVSQSCDSMYDRIAAAGGIVGKRYFQSDINYCSFNGIVSVDTYNSHYGAAVGGICGYIAENFVYALGEPTCFITGNFASSIHWVTNCYANTVFSVNISGANCGLYINTIDIYAEKCVGVLSCVSSYKWFNDDGWRYDLFTKFNKAGTSGNAEWVVDGYGCTYLDKTLSQRVKYSDCKFYNATNKFNDGIEESVMKQSCEDIFGAGTNTEPFVESLCGDDSSTLYTLYKWQQDVKIFVINPNEGSVNGKTSKYRVVKDLYDSSINQLVWYDGWYPQYMPLDVSFVNSLLESELTLPKLSTNIYKLSDLGLGTPTRSGGYKFTGWKITDGTTETVIKAGDDYTFGGKVSYTLTAQWVKNNATLTVQYEYEDQYRDGTTTFIDGNKTTTYKKSEGSTACTIAVNVSDGYYYDSYTLSGTGSIGSYNATSHTYTYGDDDATLTLKFKAIDHSFKIYFDKSYVEESFVEGLEKKFTNNRASFSETSSYYVLKIIYTVNTPDDIFEVLTSEELNNVLKTSYYNTHVFKEFNKSSTGNGQTISSMDDVKNNISGTATDANGIKRYTTTAYVIYKEKPTDITAVLHYNNSQFYVSNSLETSERDEPCTKTIIISRTKVLNSLKPYNLRETDYEDGKPEHGHYFWGWTISDHGYNVASPKMISDWVTNDINISGDTADFYAVWSTTPITMYVKYDSTKVASAPSITNDTYSSANPIWTDDKAGNIEIWANYGEQVTVGSVTLTADASVSNKFSGWYVSGNETEGTSANKGNGKPSVNITFGRSPLTLEAIIEAKGDITVTLDYQDATDGNELKFITVKEGGKYDNLPSPTKGTYSFKGWFTSSSGGTRVTNGMNLTSNDNHTLYAQWNTPGTKYLLSLSIYNSSEWSLADLTERITFSAGESSTSTSVVLDINKSTYDLSKKTLTTYIYIEPNAYVKYWIYDWDDHELDYHFDFTYFGSNADVGDWDKRTGRLTKYNYNNFTMDTPMEIDIHLYPTSHALLTFKDYYSDGKDLTEITYKETWKEENYYYLCKYAKLSRSLKFIDGVYDYYESSTGIFYIRYKFTNFFATEFTDFLCPNNLYNNNLIRGDKIFQGYYFDEDFSGDVVTWDTFVYNQAKGARPTSAITLYAKWVPANMTVTMDANGGTIGESENWTGSGGSATKVVKYADTLGALPSTETGTLSKPYHDFDGWYYDADFEHPVSEDDNFKEKIEAGENEITIYAKWVNYEYTVEYDDNDDYMSSLIKGGESKSIGTMANSTFLTNTYYTLSENKYTRAYYTFAGWNTSADGSGKSYVDKASVYNMAGDGVRNITLYAQWTRVEHDIELKIAPSGHGHLVVKIYDYQEGKYVSPIGGIDGYNSSDGSFIISTDTVIKTHAGNTITVTAVDQVEAIRDGYFRNTQESYLGYLFDKYETALPNGASGKVLTLKNINGDGTVTAKYVTVQYTMTLSIVYGDEKAPTVTSGKLAVNPELSGSTVTLSLDQSAVSAEYLPDIGYIRAVNDDGSTCWYFHYSDGEDYQIYDKDLATTRNPYRKLENSTNEYQYTLTTKDLIQYYDHLASGDFTKAVFGQKTQNLADVYIETRKMLIDLTVKYADTYDSSADSDTLASNVTVSATVASADVSTVILGDKLTFAVTEVKNGYVFDKWELLTKNGGIFYNRESQNNSYTFNISQELIKICAVDYKDAGGTHGGPDAEIVFTVSVHLPITVTVINDKIAVKSGGIYAQGRYATSYMARHDETLSFGFNMRDGYILTGIKYRTKAYADNTWSDEAEVLLDKDDDKILLTVTENEYEVWPIYETQSFPVEVKIYVGNTSYDISDWTKADILTATVTEGDRYPQYDGYFTLEYTLLNTDDYSMMGLYAGLDGATGVAIKTTNTYSDTRAIKDGHKFSIVLKPNSDTVTVVAIISESDQGKNIWSDADSPAEYSLQNGESSGVSLTLSTGDEFTLNYETYTGYKIEGYRLNQGKVISLSDRTGSMNFTYSDSTKGKYYLIFSKVEYTIIIDNDLTKGEYTADPTTTYINHTFDLSGTDCEGYRNVGFTANGKTIDYLSDILVETEMLPDDPNETTLTITPQYIAQYTVTLSIDNKYLASSVQTYIAGEESDFIGYYDEGTVVSIVLVTNDLYHEISEYIDLDANEISCAKSEDSWTYTISFALDRNRDIVLTLDGVKHTVTVLNDMTKGTVTFTAGEVNELDDRYEVTIRHDEILGMTVTAQTGYRYDRITAGSDEQTVPFTVAGDVTLTVNYVKTYTLTTSTAGAGKGTISDGGVYDDGTSVTVIATPDTGYYLSEWVVNGQVIDASSEYTFEIDCDTTVEAHFEYIEYVFDVSAVSEYYVVTFADNKTNYHYGETANITLVKRGDKHFELRKILINNEPRSQYTGDNINMSLAVNYANFDSENKCVISASVYVLYSIIVKVADDIYKGQVFITPENVYSHNEGSDEYILRSNGKMTIRVNGSEYFTFDHMDIANTDTSTIETSTANPYYLNRLTANKTITVVMNRTKAKISVVAKTLVNDEFVDNTETIDVTAPATAEVYTDVTVTINADITGYRFEYFYYGGALTLTDSSSTFTVDKPSTCEVYAVFSYLGYKVTYQEGDNYTVISTTSTTPHKGDTLAMAISPATGYQVVGWNVDDETIESTENEYSWEFDPKDNDTAKEYIVYPIVEKIKYTVTATTNNETGYHRGTVSITYNGTTIVPTEETPDPTADVAYGDSVTLTAIVDDENEYRFIQWVHNNETYSYDETITIYNMDENRAGEYKAIFSLLTGTITVQVTPQGAYGIIRKYVNGEETTTFRNGDTVTMSIDETKITEGYAFVGWHINELSPSPDFTTNELTITLDKYNRILDGVIYAQFEPRKYKIAIDWSDGGEVTYSNANGSISGYQSSTEQYDMTDQLTLSINSNLGYRIGAIVISNGDRTVEITNFVNESSCRWTLDFGIILNIYSEELTTIYVNFDLMQFDIVASLVVTGGEYYDGAMTLPEQTTVDYGQDFDITATVAKGFRFVGWYVGDYQLTNFSDFTLTTSTIYNRSEEENGRYVLHLVAKCEYIEYNLQDNFIVRLVEDGEVIEPSDSDMPGQIEPSQDGKYRLNDDIIVNAYANTGYRLVGIYVDGVMVATGDTYQIAFAVDMQDSVFEARFEKILVTIAVTAVSTDGVASDEYGEILILDGDVVSNGFYYLDTVTILADANYGYTFAKYNVLGQDYTGTNYKYLDKNYVAYTFVISESHMDALAGDGTLNVQAIYQIMVFTITFESNMSDDSISLSIEYDGTDYTHSVQAQYNTQVTLRATCSDNLFKLLGIYNGDTLWSMDGEYTFGVERNVTLVAKFGPVISFTNFTNAEEMLYEREYNFSAQYLEIGKDILCHPNYKSYLIVNYEKAGASIAEPRDAGEYIVTVRIDLAEYADFVSDAVRLRINKYALTVGLADEVTKTYDGTCNVSKSTLESVLTLNGLPDEHADATVLVFDDVIAKLMSDGLEHKKAGTGLDLKVTGLTLTDSDNFYIVDTDGYLMYSQCGRIMRKVLRLEGVTVLNKVYDGTDVAIVSADTTPYILSSEIITGDFLSLDLDNIVYRYEDEEVGANKRVYGEAGLTGLSRDNYSLEILDQVANIHPYEITAVVNNVTYTVTDVNRDVFLPIGGTLDVKVYDTYSAKYRDLYSVIDSIVGRRNKFLVAYDIVIMSDSGTFTPTKPVMVSFALPFKVVSRVHSYLVNTQYQSLTSDVDENAINILATDMVSIAITHEQRFLPTWLIILIIAIGTVLLAGGVTVVVVISKRRQRTTRLREAMRFDDF